MPELVKVTKKNSISREWKKNKYLYIMILPVIIYYFIFCYMPMFGAVIAFKDYKPALGIFESKWVGFQWFITFFKDYSFIRILKNTVLLSLYSILWGFPAPIIFALFLNELHSNLYKRTIQTVTYLPHFISVVVVCGLLTQFLNSEGVISNIVAIFTGSSENLLVNPKNFRTIYIASDIWQGVGYGSIIYLSALAGIDQEMYEAATIDGASRFRKILSITLPCLMPTIVIMFILRMGSLMSIGYEKVMLLYSPLTYETADIISTFVYRVGILEGTQFSYSTAIGLFNSVINLIMVLLSNKFSKKFTGSGLF